MWKHRADVSSHHNALSALVCLTRFVLVFVQHGVSTKFTRASPAELNYFKAGPVHGIFAPRVNRNMRIFLTKRYTPPRYLHLFFFFFVFFLTFSKYSGVFYKKLKNVSCEYDHVNGWNSTLQAGNKNLKCSRSRTEPNFMYQINYRIDSWLATDPYFAWSWNK